ncbi:unnamed protein product [Triticum turgidum subsp. durum]|uniref:Laccase n=1 Tax=Triticum turgidum subsp. durum TaxID=4567 RepID=A0A9R1NRD0_TRITD|nr:unnamed protein product [Triticum turgidum subsp. durum]
MLDSGKALGFPDGLLINGRGWNGYTFTVQPGMTYRFRITNVGLATSLNIRFQGHTIKLVEVEGSHTMQTAYSSLDVHLGQSYSVLLTADQPGFDYSIVVSTRFTTKIISTTAVLHYANSAGKAPGPLPGGPTTHVNADTPLKIADYYKIAGVFSVGTISDSPTYGGAYLRTSVMGADYRGYVEIVFENSENEVQSWHIDGYAFWVVGMNGGKWSPASRQIYNLRDGVSRYTVQVYPNAWTAIYMPLDNVGMWNVRSETWARQYLGQQFYLRVWTPSTSWRDEFPIPKNALLCGRAAGRRTRPF